MTPQSILEGFRKLDEIEQIEFLSLIEEMDESHQPDVVREDMAAWGKRESPVSKAVEELANGYDELSGALRDEAREMAHAEQQLVDPEVEAAWEKEIARRLKEIEDGTVELIPVEEFMARMKQKYG